MPEATDEKIWVAVRSQRGFISDVRAFRERRRALRQEKSWRRRMNPDYDETGVAEVRIDAARGPATFISTQCSES